MRHQTLVLTLVSFFCFTPAFGITPKASASKETPHLQFVNEYVREIATIEHIRETFEQETNESGQERILMSAIHANTAMQLELSLQVDVLKGMRLNDEKFKKLIPMLIVAYKREIQLHQRLIDISQELLAQPKPGVDYGKLGAEVPKIRAELEYTEQFVFETTPLIFATLIDMKPDSKNHVSHLIITRQEKNALIERLNTSFGEKLGADKQNFDVSSASVLREMLQGDFKCADEPWE